MGPELGEQLRLADDPAQPAACLGGVVEHDRARRAAASLEDAHQTVAQALRPLGAHRRAEPGVGVGERQNEQLRLDPLAGQDALELSEVGLRRPRGPVKLEVALRGARVLAPPFGNAPAHGGVGARVAALLHKPVVDSFGRVALLARGGPVGVEHLRDPLLVRADGPLPPIARGRRLRRHVLHVGVLRDGVAAHSERLGDFRSRHAAVVHRAYTLL